MNVLGVVILHPLRKISGAVTAAFELSKAISKKIPFTIATMWDKDIQFKEDDLIILRFRSSNPFSFTTSFIPRWISIPLYSSRIPKFIEKEKFDLVHMHNVIPTLALKKVAEVCIRKGIPYCIHTHGFMEALNYSRIMKFGLLKSTLTKFAITHPLLYVINNASWIFTLSPLDEKLLGSVDFPKERITCVTNGIKPKMLQMPSQPEVDMLRHKIGLINNKRLRLLFVGSLYKYKGVDTFIESLHYIPFPVIAIIAGKFKSRIEKNNLLMRTNSSILSRHKIIFTGWLSDAELHCLYHLADIFVYPSRGDMLPLSILDAMASRLPIVSTEVGGIPFQLAEGAGLLTKPDDPQAIAKKVIKLADDQNLRKQMGNNARKRVECYFNWDKSASIAIESFKKIIDLHKTNI